MRRGHRHRRREEKFWVLVYPLPHVRRIYGIRMYLARYRFLGQELRESRVCRGARARFTQLGAPLECILSRVLPILI